MEKKIRSSRELKESLQNLERVVNYKNDEVEVHSDMDIIMTDAYDCDIEAQKHVDEVKDELDKKGAEVVEENPEAPMKVKNDYTKQLKLDESISDFKLNEDGRKKRVAARDEDEGDLYLEYDMLEFVYELLSAGSKGITNVAPKTPIVHRRKTPKGPILELPMSKFSPNGSQVINKEYVYLLDLNPVQSKEIKQRMSRITPDVAAIIQEYAFKADKDSYMVEEVFDDLCDQIPGVVARLGKDAVGYAFLNNIKTLGTPQISEAGNKVVVYSDDIEDFTQAAEGLMTYGITCEPPAPKRNKTSHWDYSMVVNVPTYSDGEPMMFEDWLAETGRSIDDVMDPAVAQRFKNKFAKADALDAEFRKTKLTDDIIDEYADRAMDIDPDDSENMLALYNEMCSKLTDNGIKCDATIRARFSDETGYEF